MTTRRTLFMLLFALVPACDDSAGGTVADVAADVGLDAATGADVSGADTSAPIDTTAPDTAAPPDTSAPIDTSTPDTTVDTTPADTTPADTTPADTTPADTTPVDTAAPSDTSGAPPAPGALGPYAVTTQTRTIDGFAMQLHIPTGVSPAPLVFLSPGFMLEAKSFSATGKHLASHGYVVAVPTWGDNAFAPIAHSTLADEVSVILDALLAPNATPVIDPARVAAAGHSRGGKITILAATRDDRIQAVFGLDPVDSVGPTGPPTPQNPSVTPELMGGLVVPFAVIGSSLGGQFVIPPACAPAEDNYQQYYDAATAAPTRNLWVAPNSGHNDFGTDLGLIALVCQAGSDPAATRTFAHEKLVAFFKVHLDGDTRYSPWL